MAHLFRLILLLIILPWFYGCNQTVIKNSLPDNTQPPIQAEKPEVPSGPVEAGEKDEPAPVAADPIQPAELPEAIDTEATLTENSAPTNGKVAENGKKIEIALDEALDFIRASHEFWQAGELDNALEALDKAYSLILDVDTADNPKLIQQKEDLRFLISKRILEIYASRHIVVNGHHKAIPMDMNRHIQNEIKLFTNGERKFFIESYRRNGPS